MKLSSKAHYGLQACQILAEVYDASVSATELEEKVGVSGKYLEKIMRILTGCGVVAARRGAQGGYYLAVSYTHLDVYKRQVHLLLHRECRRHAENGRRQSRLEHRFNGKFRRRGRRLFERGRFHQRRSAR